MSKITAIIVDDEEHARQALRMALSDFEDFEIIAECENGVEAVKAVNELDPAVMFLDVQMPKLDGFDVLELLGDKGLCVVFVTAYDEYAVQAFDNNAVDYLLKPVDPDRLKKTIAKVVDRISSQQVPAIGNLLADSSRQKGPLERILVRDRSEVHVIAVDSICYFEAADGYIAIQTETATHIKQERLTRLEEKLNPYQFCRIHRSYLLNVNYLSRIESETKDTRIAILKNGKRLPISRNGYASLRKLL